MIWEPDLGFHSLRSLTPGYFICHLRRQDLADGLVVDLVVEADRAQLLEIVHRVRDGRLRTNIGTVATLDNAVAALNPPHRTKGKTIIRPRP